MLSDLSLCGASACRTMGGERNSLIFYQEPGADWPSGEFPVAWQPIWPAALHFFFFFFYNLLLLFYIVVVVFVAYRMY